jgi:hypothetical protein
MKTQVIIRTLENEAHRHIVEEILCLLEKHPVSVGAAKNILDAAGATLNFSAARIGTVPRGENLWEELPGHRRTLAKSVTDILLRDASDDL